MGKKLRDFVAMFEHGPVQAVVVIQKLKLSGFGEFERLMKLAKGYGVTFSQQCINKKIAYMMTGSFSEKITNADYVAARDSYLKEAVKTAKEIALETGKPYRGYVSRIMDDLCCEHLGTLQLWQALEGRERFTPGACRG